MQFTAIATVAGGVLATAGLAASAALVLIPQADPGAQVWFDYPVAARQVPIGELTVTSHTDIAGATAISLRFTRDGQQAAVLTDTELEVSGQGANAPLLHWASVPWNPPAGEYEVEASVYRGSTVVGTRKSKLTVIGLVPLPGGRPVQTIPPEPRPSETVPTPTETMPTPTPTLTLTETAPTPEPSKTTPMPEPSKTTPTPKPTKTTPTPKPTKTTPTPEPSVTLPEPPEPPTPEPPPPPLGGKVTRAQLDDKGWKNTFTVSGLRPGDAAIWVEVNLKNPEKRPAFNGWQSYPCGSVTLESGSGPSAKYSCTVTFTIEPPDSWKGGSGEFRYWPELPDSIFRSKVVTASETVYGSGGTWTVTRKNL